MFTLTSVWTVDIIASIISTFLLLWLFAFYLRKVREIKSRFSIGLTALTAK